MPTPVKYRSEVLRDAYKAIERESAAAMASMLPPELEEEVTPYITGDLLTAPERKLLKAADRLSALIKCMEEARSGNHEFDAAPGPAEESPGRHGLPRGGLVHGALPALLHPEPGRADPPGRRPGVSRAGLSGPTCRTGR